MAIAGVLVLAGCPTPNDPAGDPGGGSTPVTFDSADTAGQKVNVTADSITFKMAYVPGGFSFKTQDDDVTTDPAELNSISSAYFIGETEVTYELWYKVYEWAKNGTGGATGEGQYIFANTGIPGHDGTAGEETTSQEPVTTINWRDSIVWCNALTEWYNAHNGTEADLDVVYYTDGSYHLPLRTSTDNNSINTELGSEDKPCIKADLSNNIFMANCTAKGFRLPTIAEWSCAARYKGSDSSNGAYEYPVGSGNWWTPGLYASGATAMYNNADATQLVAVYEANSNLSTAVVKSLGNNSANALGLFDMSGNVYEFNFDWCPGYVGRTNRSGCWGVDALYVRIGHWAPVSPYFESYLRGFRLCKTQ